MPTTVLEIHPYINLNASPVAAMDIRDWLG
jgi:hypothetical protein